MAEFEIWALPESDITISDGGKLDGVSQGDATHLLNHTITLASSNLQSVTITDSEGFFADSDRSQSLTNATTFDGVPHAAGLRVEAEYQVFVSDAAGNTYTLVGFNINEAGHSPEFGTVEGLAFLGDLPPIGEALTVNSVSEGPGSAGTPYSTYYAPPCFLEGTKLDTPGGPRRVETLKAGDLVTTLDDGPQALIWRGYVQVSRAAVLSDPRLRPVRVEAKGGSLYVSPQHRLLVSDWRAQIACGGDVLVAAKHLAEAGQAHPMADRDLPSSGITYWHILFETHQLVTSNGILSESFRPGPETAETMPDAHAEFRRFFPEAWLPPVRPCASSFESRVIASV